MTLAGGRASVVVIGGGLAGISAAIRLADAGLEVALLEARPWLGGATWSFARRGLTIDNGQHAFLRCCVAYRDLLARLGVEASTTIQDELDLTVLGPHAQARVRRSWLPAPWHLARSLAGYRLLSRSERAKVAAAAVALQFVDVAAGGDRSLGEWLSRHGQDERARRLFWDQLSLSALNVDSERADLSTAASAIRAALLTRRDSADLGVPSVPLSQLHGSPAVELLRQLKVMVRLGVRASSLRPNPAGGWEIGLAYGGHTAAAQGAEIRREAIFEHGQARINAAGVVLAVPAWEAAVVAPDSLARDAARWTQLEPSPVMSIHVVYGSRVTELPFAAAADSPVHWVMDKTGPGGLYTGQYLAASVRAADAYLDMPAAQLRAEFLPALDRLFPAAAQASVEDFFVTRERRATIAHVPGSQELRVAGPGLAGFALAGAWTDTGWPDTMEGAVRSGRAAAQKLIEELPARGAVAAGRIPASKVPASKVPARRVPDCRVAGVTGPANVAQASVAPAAKLEPARTAPASTVSPSNASAGTVSASTVSVSTVSASTVCASPGPSSRARGGGDGREARPGDLAVTAPAGGPEDVEGRTGAESPEVVVDPALPAGPRNSDATRTSDVTDSSGATESSAGSESSEGTESSEGSADPAMPAVAELQATAQAKSRAARAAPVVPVAASPVAGSAAAVRHASSSA